jgi:hypothetical protein
VRLGKVREKTGILTARVSTLDGFLNYLSVFQPFDGRFDARKLACFKAKNPSRVSTFDFRPEFHRSKQGLELSLALD